MNLYKYTRRYYEMWRVAPVPIIYYGDQQKPLVKWSELYDDPEPRLPGDREAWRRAHGIAIIPRGNHVVIDIDRFDMLGVDRLEIAKQFARIGIVVVLTKRGLHVHFNAERPVGELRLYIRDLDGKEVRVGEGGGALYKHMWASPPTNRNGFVYRFVTQDGKLTTNIPNLPKLELRDVESVTDAVLGVKLVELQHGSVSGSGVRLAEIDPIPGIEKLNTQQLIALLAAIYHAMNCPGLRDLMLEWSSTGTVHVRKFPWANRTSRFYLLHTVAATLALLGATEQQVADVLNTYEDLDGKPHDSHESALWTVFKWNQDLFRRLYVLRRGECPFCSLRGYRNCGKNPVMRLYWWLQSRGRETVKKLVKHLLN